MGDQIWEGVYYAKAVAVHRFHQSVCNCVAVPDHSAVRCGEPPQLSTRKAVRAIPQRHVSGMSDLADTRELSLMWSDTSAIANRSLAIMLGNPKRHFRRWEGVAVAAEFDTQYSLLTATYENMSVCNFRSRASLAVCPSRPWLILCIVLCVP